MQAVQSYLQQWGREADVIELDESTATVPLAAAALGVEPARIAKSLSLLYGEGAMVLVTAGDRKIDNRKFKDYFGFKAKMLSHGEALEATGHAVGGVCPFALPDEVKVFLDESLLQYETVFPACGTGNSAIELTPAELEEYSQSSAWVDVCKSGEGR